jgi:uncharacterized membrane protein YcaP (DUF421 family)
VVIQRGQIRPQGVKKRRLTVRRLLLVWPNHPT